MEKMGSGRKGDLESAMVEEDKGLMKCHSEMRCYVMMVYDIMNNAATRVGVSRIHWNRGSLFDIDMNVQSQALLSRHTKFEARLWTE